jgi:hypothetical protein
MVNRKYFGDQIHEYRRGEAKSVLMFDHTVLYTVIKHVTLLIRRIVTLQMYVPLNKGK